MRTRMHARPAGWLAAALLGGALLSGCGALDDLLGVDKPSVIDAATLDDPVKAPLLVNGVVADFECAAGAYVVMGGLVGEEFVDATQTADRWPYDRRDVQPGDTRYATSTCQNIGVYTPLATTRYTADRVLEKLDEWTDAQVGAPRTRLIATTAAYGGYAYLLLGEGFCSAAIDGGPELTPRQMFELAESRFTRAIQEATALGGGAGDTLRWMALVGRARARINLSQFVPAKLAEAGADAALVPAGYAFKTGASNVDERRNNRVFSQNNQSQLVSVGPRYRNLTVEGVADTRVRATDTGRNATDGTRLWAQGKYASLSDSIPVATYDEARLILAEVALRGGSPDGAVAIIDALRARAGLPAYSGARDAASVLALLVEERRRELFLEGHHLYDAIRFGIALQPAAGTTFSKGGVYGDTKCLPLPNVERLNNPNLRG